MLWGVRQGMIGGGGGLTLHFEVLVAFTTAESKLFCVIADKHDPVAWVYGTRTVEAIVN